MRSHDVLIYPILKYLCKFIVDLIISSSAGPPYIMYHCFKVGTIYSSKISGIEISNPSAYALQVLIVVFFVTLVMCRHIGLL